MGRKTWDSLGRPLPGRLNLVVSRQTALQTMLTIVDAHNIPIIVSARPRGLTKIGAIPDDWATGVLAPLSPQHESALKNSYQILKAMRTQ